MIQKNYKEIAEIIKIEKGFGSTKKDLYGLVIKLADYFEKENPPFTQYFKKSGFDRKQFLKDCGEIKEEEVQ